MMQSDEDYYVVCNGRLVDRSEQIDEDKIYRVCYRLPGGKGGFGSMLRTIGAQIEKTTNREAMRDLSGRRMRDINNEKKLADWVAGAGEREKEQEERRRERLEKRRAEAEGRMHKFKDEKYLEQKDAVSHNLDDALTQGLKRSTVAKHSGGPLEKKVKKVAPSTSWTGLDLSDMSSSDDEESCKDQRVKSDLELIRAAVPVQTDLTPKEALTTIDSSKLNKQTTKSTDSQGQATAATNSMGQTTKATDSQAQTSKATDSQGQTTKATDSQGQTTKATDSQGQTATESQGQTTAATDSQGQKTKASDSQGQTTAATDSQGQTIKATDNQGQTIEVADSQGQTIKATDSQGQTIKVTDSQGQTTKATDSQGQTIKAIDSQGQTIKATDSQGQTTKATAKQGQATDSEESPPHTALTSSCTTSIDLDSYKCSSELEGYGLEHLKQELSRRGLKCGGSLAQRAERLYSVKGLTADQIDRSLFAKKKR